MSLHKKYVIIISVVQVRDLRSNNFSVVTQPVNERGQQTAFVLLQSRGLNKENSYYFYHVFQKYSFMDTQAVRENF